jgi:hypothetical protein
VAKPPRVPARVGVDEKSADRGQDYITAVSDRDRGTVEYVPDKRRQGGLDSYSEFHTPSNTRASTRWRWTCGSRTPARCAAASSNPIDEKIDFDRHHVKRYLITAVDTVRKAKAGR